VAKGDTLDTPATSREVIEDSSSAKLGKEIRAPAARVATKKQKDEHPASTMTRPETRNHAPALSATILLQEEVQEEADTSKTNPSKRINSFLQKATK
jgi:hypothetical protein